MCRCVSLFRFIVTCARRPYVLHRICWPFLAGEAFNAIHLSETLKVAYELIEVRSGHAGLRRIFRTGRTPSGSQEAIFDEASRVLELAFGPDGARKRTAIRQLQAGFRSEWNEGGDSCRAAKKFVEDVIEL